MPIMQAFYQEVPETRIDSSKYGIGEKDLLNKEKLIHQRSEEWRDLQRIVIWSDILLRELTSIFSGVSKSPPFV